MRVYIEHWHGPGQNVDCGAGGTINVSVALNGETPIYLPLKKKYFHLKTKACKLLLILQ
jgi:hypothetical protein